MFESNQPPLPETGATGRPVKSAFLALTPSSRSTPLFLGLLLALVTVLCCWPVTRNGFVSIDDPEYITENPRVLSGLSWAGLAWAFTTGKACNWHPLTWLSHMADCELYGLNPAGHHFTNLLVHTLDSLLLFLLLQQMTGALWRSAVVAALFALHPLHVESVAWASERKDVLSAFFWITTLMSYVSYVRSRGLSKYALTLSLFALGLMAKPMVVTLPFVLLLLDFWPLRRLVLAVPPQSGTPSPHPSVLPPFRLVVEKLPFFILTMVASTVTYLVQKTGGAVSSLTALPLPLRLSNAVMAYVQYIAKALWPFHLSVVYPYTTHLPAAHVVGAALLLVLLTGLFALGAVRYPYLLTGWLWFLGTLVPVIGLVQVGAQSMADRYMYLPGIGLFVMLAWGLTDLMQRSPLGHAFLAIGGIGAVTACAACTLTQIGYWHDSEKLFRHALDVTSNNYLAYDGLGSALARQGRGQEALALCQESVRLMPAFAQGQYDLGTVLMKQGNPQEAVEHLSLAVQIQPGFAEAHINLGQAFLQLGRRAEAEAHLARAPNLVPDYPDAQYNLGTVLLKQGKAGEAVEHFSRALRLKPDYAEAHANLGVALMTQGKSAEGIAHLTEALRLDPADTDAACNLGIALLESKRPAEAAARLSEAVRLKPDVPRARYFLASALAQQGKTAEALPHAEKARDLARAAGQEDLASKAESLLKLCQSGAPLQPSP